MVNHFYKPLGYFPSALIFLLVSVYYFSITSDDGVAGFLTDDAVYLLMAEVYSPWHTHTDSLLEFIRNINHFPPFYPVIMGLFGVNSNTPVLASHISISFLLLGFIFIGTWLYIETRNLFVCSVIPLIFALLPGSIIFSQGLWSEFLFICLLYNALSILSIDNLSSRHWLAAALFISLLSLTRTTGVAMIAAFCTIIFIRKPKHYLLYSGISLAPFLCWFFLVNLTNTNNAYLVPLSGSLVHANIHAIAVSLIDKTNTFIYSLLWLITGTDTTGLAFHTVFIFTALFIITSLPVFIRRLIQNRFDSLFLLFYLIVIFIWPFFDVYYVSRFLFPVLPIFIFYTWSGISTLFRNNYKYITAVILSVYIIITAAPGTLHFSNLATTSVGDELNQYRRHRTWLYSRTYDEAVTNATYTKNLISSLRQLRNIVPINECIYSIHTALVMLQSHRISGALPEPDKPDRAFERETGTCNYIIAMKMVDQGGTYPAYYPMMRLHDRNRYKVTPIFPDGNENTRPFVYLIKIIRK